MLREDDIASYVAVKVVGCLNGFRQVCRGVSVLHGLKGGFKPSALADQADVARVLDEVQRQGSNQLTGSALCNSAHMLVELAAIIGSIGSWILQAVYPNTGRKL